jgi:isoleucyl-tRNA synthetase
VIWTTTPWTLPANQAVAVHPEFDYSLVATSTPDGEESLLIASELARPVLERAGVESFREVARVKGAALEGLKLSHPFYRREVPVILGEHVTLESGTGAVHTAPGHGQEDFVVGQRYGLPVDNPVGGDGRFLPATELFAGRRSSTPIRKWSRCCRRGGRCCITSLSVTATRTAGGTRRR